MGFFSEHATLIAFSLMFLVVFVSLKGLKGQKEDLTEIKNWVTRESWKGEIAQGKLVSWKQTKSTSNFDYFFVLTFEADLDGSNKNYTGASSVKVSDISKLKKGLPLVIKYKGVPPTKTAVISVEYD